MKLPFSTSKGYGPVVDRPDFNDRLECYLEMPVIRWLETHVGKFKWPRESGEIVHGNGWSIVVDYQYLIEKDRDDSGRKIRVYVCFDEPLSEIQTTEFLLMFL